jgi:hypothetical protein
MLKNGASPGNFWYTGFVFSAEVFRMRRLRRAAILVLLVLITLFFPLLAPPAHRIDDTHFALIQEGMTEAEVEAILGAPAGNYDWAVQDEASRFRMFRVTLAYSSYQHRIAAAERVLKVPASLRVDVSGQKKIWISRHGAFYAALDQQGKVLFKGNPGKTRIDPPWQRWWRKFTAK